MNIRKVIAVLLALPSSILTVQVSSAAQADNQLSEIDYPLISVPAGSYTLLIPDNNFFKLDHLEKKVSFDSAFQIGKFEVSNRLWNECFKFKGCNRPATLREGETLDSDNFKTIDYYKETFFKDKQSRIRTFMFFFLNKF